MLGGVVLYAGLLVPTFVRAHIFCRPSAFGLSYMCGGIGMPAVSSLLLWLLGLPFFVLFMSSRLRTATSFGSPFRWPRSAGKALALVVAALALILAFLSWPDWSTERAPVDLAKVLTGVLFAFYAFLLSLAHDETAPRPATTARRRGLLGGVGLWIQGVSLYAGAAVMIVVEMGIQIASCRSNDAEAVCDGPAYGAMGEFMLWACALPLYLVLLWAAIGRNGAKAWRRIEPRLAVLLVAILLLLKAVSDVRAGWIGAGPSLFWLVFAAWLVLLMELCRRAAKERLS
jgi:hypothetical protein